LHVGDLFKKFPKNQSFIRPNKVFTDPPAGRPHAAERAMRASSRRPITVAERGFATMS